MSLFPMFLKLTARPCVVVGAGAIAEGKIEALLAAAAHITVIAPEGLPRVAGWAEAGEVMWHRRVFEAGDTAGAFLVIAGTNTPAVNRAVFAEANAANILCNAVDDPPFCDFFFPSIVRRGELTIAISTAGESPALAQRLRKEINAQLALDTGDWLQELGRLRREVTAVEPIGEPRKMLLHELAQREVCGYDGCPSRMRARQHFREQGLWPAKGGPTHDIVNGVHAPGSEMVGGADLGRGANRPHLQAEAGLVKELLGESRPVPERVESPADEGELGPLEDLKQESPEESVL